MKFIKKYWKIIIVVFFVLFIVQKIVSSLSPKDKIVKKEDVLVVETFSLNKIKEGKLDTFCSVEALVDTSIVSELGGKVTSVSISEGGQVKKGQTLFEVENISQRLAVQNARVSLKSAQLALSNLLNDNSGDINSILGQTQNQQEITLASVKNDYFNTDLKAYPEDYDESSSAPTILGNYTCEAEGEYIIETYGSAATSGASIRMEGLETGRSSVSTDYEVPLGSCGLKIVFPKDFKKNKTWVIPVPNTRSSQFYAAKKDYESLKAGNILALNTTQASPEQISQERARVTQAQLQLEQAQFNLNKSYVKAPIDGIVTGFDLEVGDYVAINQQYGRIKSIGLSSIVAYINADEKNYISKDSLAFVDGEELSVELVSPSIDDTKKIKVTLSHSENSEFIEGTEVACSIQRMNTQETEQEMIVPLSSISIIGTEPYVMVVEDNIAYKKQVITGAILGKDIVIYGIDSGEIVKDARSVRDQQKVIIK